jgi:hypothetical protein
MKGVRRPTTFRACICCGADQSEYHILPYCSRCVSGTCPKCRSRLLESESAPLEVCMCCGEDRQFKYRKLPFCGRCVSGTCGRCRSWVRVKIWRLDPKAINLISRSPGPRMLCGWGCGAKLTASQMRSHFTNCPRRPTVQETIRNLPRKPNRGGRPPGPRMLCGWRCGAKLTATTMRRHFAQCPRRPRPSAGGVFL